MMFRSFETALFLVAGGDYDRLLPHTVQNTASDSLTGAPQCGQYLLVRCGWAGSSGSRENTTGFPCGAGCVTGSAGSGCAGTSYWMGCVGASGHSGCAGCSDCAGTSYWIGWVGAASGHSDGTGHSGCAGRVGGTGEDGCGALAVLLHITYYSSGVIYNGRNTMPSSSLKSPVCKT